MIWPLFPWELDLPSTFVFRMAWSQLMQFMFSNVRDGYYAEVRQQRRSSLPQQRLLLKQVIGKGIRKQNGHRIRRIHLFQIQNRWKYRSKRGLMTFSLILKGFELLVSIFAIQQINAAKQQQQQQMCLSVDSRETADITNRSAIRNGSITPVTESMTPNTLSASLKDRRRAMLMQQNISFDMDIWA